MKSALKIFLAFVLLVVLAPTAVLAAQAEKPQVVSIEIGNDFYAAGNSVTLLNDAEDDAFLAGAVVNATKKVAHDLFTVGSSVMILSEVGDDLRAAGSVLTLAGKTAGDLVAAGGVVNFSDTASVGGDAALAGGVLNFAGSVGKNLRLAGDEINFAGQVGGDALIRTGKKITFADGAKITGKLTYFSKDELQIPDGLAASVEHKSSDDFDKLDKMGDSGESGFAAKLVGKIFLLLVGFVTGAILLALFGKSSEVFASQVRERFWGSLLAGVIAFFAPLLAILLLATIVGAWFAGIFLAMWVAGLLAAGALVGFMVGSLILNHKKEMKYSRKLLALALGWAIFIAIGFIPGFGKLLQLTIFIFTLGAGVLTDIDLYKKMKKAKLL
ncbi:MAG: hypothetical protein V1936_05140 [Patescibacteria group bacterium]